jgi:hypothetical protein
MNPMLPESPPDGSSVQVCTKAGKVWYQGALACDRHRNEARRRTVAPDDAYATKTTAAVVTTRTIALTTGHREKTFEVRPKSLYG